MPLKYEEQADLLLSRGLIADKIQLIDILKKINYYRLSGYLYFFRLRDKENYKEGTDLGKVLKIYCFDQNLRKILFKPIEEIEIKLKAFLGYYLAHTYGAFGYLEEKYFNLNANQTAINAVEKKKIDKNCAKFKELKESLKYSMSHSKESFVKHFLETYNDGFPPIWIATELLTFGEMITLFKCLKENDLIVFSDELKISKKVFVSWIISVNTLRNICAHHGRLWKRKTGGIPMIPRGSKYMDWNNINNVDNNILYLHITILHYLCKHYSLNREWENEVAVLFSENASITRADYGFSDEWEKTIIWNEKQLI